MADVASPSTQTFTEQPQGGGFGASAMGLIRKYWYVALALAIIVGFLLYNYIRSSSAQVGNTNTNATDSGAQAATTGMGQSNLPDASSILDLLSQSYQAMADAISTGAMVATTSGGTLAGASGATTPATANPNQAQPIAQVSAPATIQPRGTTPQAQPMPTAPAATAPKTTTPAPGTVLNQPNTGQQEQIQGFFGTPFTPAVTQPGFAPKTSGTIAQRNTSGAQSPVAASAPAAQQFRASVANLPIFGRIVQKAIPGNPSPTTIHLSGRAGGNLGVGGPPPSGPAVPFGTHVATHRLLDSTGSMYARSR